ncbi:hypothetical protein EV283_1045 [Sphingomonas sp. BK036]|uniref:hypothetical protein n=1 Tax=Sphingomonas sp. BK036 TaxID=2512122 RepID=UPI001029B7A5|nr:hypothetical protein [Sphingomonas sp. BK036]RZT56988.1 hypothetical protein EV283_1045 [Sphingomonas sp. BK036]
MTITGISGADRRAQPISTPSSAALARTIYEMLSDSEHAADTIAAIASAAEIQLYEVERSADAQVAMWLDRQMSDTHHLLRLMRSQALALAEVVSNANVVCCPQSEDSRTASPTAAETIRPRTRTPGVLRRCLRAIEPWYDWDRINIARLDAQERDFSDESEGEAYRFSLQWLGVHVSIQTGRVPPKVSPDKVAANKRNETAGGVR